MHRYLLLGALLLAAHPAHATSCEEVPPTPKILSAARLQLRPGGGLVLGDVSGRTYAVDPLTVWRLRGGPALALTSIAPGLDVVRTEGPAILEDDKGTVLVDARAVVPGAIDKRLAAPAPKRVVLRRTGTLVSEYRLEHVIVTVASPAEAIALVMYDEHGNAMTWGFAGAGVNEVMVYEGGSCGTNAKGTRGPWGTDKVRFAWLDVSGRLSAKSKPITVTLVQR